MSFLPGLRRPSGNSFEGAPDYLRTSAGSDIVPVPQGATFVRIDAIAKGGNGASAPASNVSGGGGGGGAYSRVNALDVRNITNLFVEVASDAAVFIGTNNDGTVVCRAYRGNSASGQSSGSGGSSGNCIGDVKFSGGGGSDGIFAEYVGPPGGNGGGAAGSNGSGSGSSGGSGDPAGGSGSNSPGGGGRGADGGVGTQGGTGRPGYVRLRWS